jgi:hypothetical protein
MNRSWEYGRTHLEADRRSVENVRQMERQMEHGAFHASGNDSLAAPISHEVRS